MGARNSGVDSRFSLPELDLATYLASGLTNGQVQIREKLGLTNNLKLATSRSLLHILSSNLFTLFNTVIAIAFVIVMFLGKWQDALFGIPVVINILIGIIQEIRSKRALDKLSFISSSAATVKRNGESVSVPVAEVVIDDLLELKAGDQVIADAIILQAKNLAVDESLVSGEAEPVSKVAGSALVSGSVILSGFASARVTQVGLATFSGRMNQEARRYKLANSEIRKAINRIIFWISILLLPLAIIVCTGQISAYGGWQLFISGESTSEVLVSAVASIISMVPQGLVLLASISFALAAIRLARDKVLTQELPAVETLARVDVICFDKTGTLTTNQLSVDTFQELESQILTNLKWQEVLAAFSQDPNANQSAKAIGRQFKVKPTAKITNSVQFDSNRRWSSFSFQLEDVQESWLLGSAEVLFAYDQSLLSKAKELAAKGFRVLALCSTQNQVSEDIELPRNLTPRLLISLTEEIRVDASQTIKYFEEEKVAIRILSGDDPLTVAAVARKCGITAFGTSETQVFDASDLPENDQALADLLERQFVFGRVRPEQKERIVKVLQTSGHVVAMTGDGVNDCLALKQADLGIAMESGSAATKAIAKLVLVGGEFRAIPKVVAEGRRVIANLERVSSLFLTKTVWAMVLAVSFGLLSWKFAILPRQLTAFDIYAIGIPSFALALLPNTKRYQAGFLARTLRFSIPAGMVIAMAVLFTPIIFNAVSPESGPSSIQTGVLLVLSVSSLWVVTSLARPLTAIKTLIVLSCYACFALILTIPSLAGFIGLVSLSQTELLWAALLGLMSALLIAILNRPAKELD